MRILKLGALGFLLETAEAKLLIDPVLTDDRIDGIFDLAYDLQFDPGELKNLPLDAVVLSHYREAQFHLPSLHRLGRDVPIFYPKGNVPVPAYLRRLGFGNLVGMAPGELHKLKDLELEALPAGPMPCRNYRFASGGRSILFLGAVQSATGWIAGMESRLRESDLLLMDCSMMGSAPAPAELLADTSVFERECARLKSVVDQVRPRRFVPLASGLKSAHPRAGQSFDLVFKRDALAKIGQVSCLLNPGDRLDLGGEPAPPGLNLRASRRPEGGSPGTPAPENLSPESLWPDGLSEKANKGVLDFLQSELLYEVEQMNVVLSDPSRQDSIGWELRVVFEGESERSFFLKISGGAPAWRESLEPIHVRTVVHAADLWGAIEGKLSMQGLRASGLIDWRLLDAGEDRPGAPRIVFEPLSICSAGRLFGVRAQRILGKLGVDTDIEDRGEAWFPMGIRKDGEGISIDIISRQELDLRGSFFFQTVRENVPGSFWKSMSLERFSKSPQARRTVEPAAFIYHCSRCGSTLVSQMLSRLPEFLVLSEPTVLESLFHFPNLSVGQRTAVAISTINSFGASMRGPEEKLAIKFAGSTNWIAWLQEVYPETPWIFVYREPRRVLISNLLRPPSWLARYESKEEKEKALSRKYQEHFDSVIANVGRAALLVDYPELTPEFPARLLNALKLPISAERLTAMQESMNWYSKRPQTQWGEKSGSYLAEDVELNAALLAPLQERYELLNRKRASASSRR